MRARRCAGDAGQVGGIEALPFGLLIFVVGTLLIANAWAVIDAKFAGRCGALVRPAHLRRGRRSHRWVWKRRRQRAWPPSRRTGEILAGPRSVAGRT